MDDGPKTKMLIKAPYIITLEGPPLKDHAILVEEGIIRHIASQKEFKKNGECLELPNTILLPGLVNCHSHLELSSLPKSLPYPGSFVHWVEELGLLKMQSTPLQIKEGMRLGIQKLLEGGTTTVADHLSSTADPAPLLDSPLEGIAYIEVLGVEAKRAEMFYQQAMEKSKIPNPKSQIQIIPTPHATYSLLPEVFSKVVSSAQPFSIHISESAEEYLLFKENRGPLFEFLETKGKTPPTIGETPLQYLKRLHLLPRQTMAIHANYLEDEDISILQGLQMSVVHCPGSHAYFEHDRFPLGLLEDAGINVALGTDSLASNHSLSMLEQMRTVLENYAELTPEAVLKMATLNGAKALGQENEIGSLAVGKRANIIGVSLRYPKASLLENILLSEQATFVMIGERVNKK